MNRQNENFENIARVVNFKDDNVDVHSDLDIVTADAYDENIKNEKRVAEIKDELDKTAAEAIPTGTTEFGNVPENTYTKKLTLDESLEDEEASTSDDENIPVVKDGRSSKVFEDDDDDVYVDYDMFDFIYSFVTSESWPKPKNPLSTKRVRTFMFTGEDDYLKTNSNKGLSQVGVEGDSIVLYGSDPKDFKDVKEFCDIYGFEYKGPTQRTHTEAYWKYTFKIYVPVVTPGYPMSLEDYFEPRGLTIADVMGDDFAKKRAKNIAKDLKVASKYIDDKATAKAKAENDALVDGIYQKYLIAAANSNDPLKIFINAMFKEMSSEGLKFNRTKLKKDFEEYFLDEFDDEDEI